MRKKREECWGAAASAATWNICDVTDDPAHALHLCYPFNVTNLTACGMFRFRRRILGTLSDYEKLPVVCVGCVGAASTLGGIILECRGKPVRYVHFYNRNPRYETVRTRDLPQDVQRRVANWPEADWSPVLHLTAHRSRLSFSKVR